MLLLFLLFMSIGQVYAMRKQKPLRLVPIPEEELLRIYEEKNPRLTIIDRRKASDLGVNIKDSKRFDHSKLGSDKPFNPPEMLRLDPKQVYKTLNEYNPVKYHCDDPSDIQQLCKALRIRYSPRDESHPEWPDAFEGALRACLKEVFGHLHVKN